MLDTIKGIIKEISPDTNIEDLTPETRFAEELGFDSPSMMLMYMKIEETFGFRFEGTVKFETVGQVFACLESRGEK